VKLQWEEIMSVAPSLSSPLFLDLEDKRVWRGEQHWQLTPKAFAVLCYLVEHSGRLVTKDELLHAVWPNRVVSEWALWTCIREIREALSDNIHAPQYIQTVHRRGYCFIAQATCGTHLPVPRALSLKHRATNLIGRGVELRQLHGWLQKALSGERQIVFVTGEAGIGKTALVKAFLQQVASDQGVWIGYGQCLGHYGVGEAYLPVLEALGRLCCTPGHERLLTALQQYAPTWLWRMPALIRPSDLEALQRGILSATQEHMLREMAEAMEAVTAQQPLILWLKDLQWSDFATLDLLSYLAWRSGPTRLLAIGTYRPVDVIVRGHPLREVKPELQVHGRCQELPLELLTKSAVEAYLTLRFSPKVLEGVSLQALARLVYQRTEGNPLFMVNVTEFLVVQGLLVEKEDRWELRSDLGDLSWGIPQTIRQMIEKQFERLSTEEQHLLEASSVAGMGFSALEVAAGLGETVEEVERQCAALARRELFVQERGKSVWPDGTVTGYYEFLHALYQQVLYERISVGRRVRLHRSIGEREEQGYGQQAGKRAAVLAMHFTQGRDYHRAVQYHRQAAANAFGRHAYREAITHLTKGLELLDSLPEAPKRIHNKLDFLTVLGSIFMSTKGYASPEVERLYVRAMTLCQQTEETVELFPSLWGLFYFHLVRAHLYTARDLGTQCLAIAQRKHDPSLLLLAHEAMGILLFHCGEFAAARKHLEQSSALYNSQQYPALASCYDQGIGIAYLSYGALTLWALGYPEQAWKRCHEVLALARSLGYPYGRVMSLLLAVWLCQVSGDRIGKACQWVEEALRLATQHGFPELVGHAREFRGWALGRQGALREGIEEMRCGFVAVQATGATFTKPNLLAALAEAQGAIGQVAEGLNILTEALVVANKTEECWYEAELHRLKGELSPDPQAEAEVSLWRALEIARRQQAKSLELRVAVSLARLWQKQGKKAEAWQLLSEIYRWFTEGFDRKDLQEAKALLDRLS
jgi:DNA-binding winged helix-turn-helix (wHTH) protein/predicted ATPase